MSQSTTAPEGGAPARSQTPKNIFGEISAEVIRAKTLHPKDGPQDLFKILTIIGEEQGECCKAALEHTEALARGDAATARQRSFDLRKELTQLAATAYQAIELYDAHQLTVYGDQLSNAQS